MNSRHLVGLIILLIIIMVHGNTEPSAAQDCDISDNDFTITPSKVQNTEALRVVVIGDSIAWGVGLKHNEKYSYLVAEWLANKTNRPVNLKILAQTGANLNGPYNLESCHQECGNSYPSVEEQIKRIEDPENVDLILLSGGINNVNVFNIINSDTSPDRIAALTNDIGPILENILKDLLIKCPKAKIVETNYYPIITKSTVETEGFGIEYSLLYSLVMHPPSDTNIKIPLTKDKSITIPKSQVNLPPDGYEDVLIKNSEVFDDTSTIKIQSAINMANRYYQDNSNKKEARIVFAPVNFPPSQCYNTKNSLLWKIDISAKDYSIKGTNDNQWSCRSGHCPCCNDCVESPEDKINIFNKDKVVDWFAAIGHPNVEGAKEYNRTIVQKIGETWPDWLHPTVLAFEVLPTTLTSGEAFKINYEVSSNCSEGLKQVELWRKDETSDWQEIKPPNTLSGENGPLSGSFTDAPAAPGKYWYGVHVVDNAGNWNDERNSNTNGQPSVYGPIEVYVTETKLMQEQHESEPVTLKLYVRDGSAEGPIISYATVKGQDASGKSFEQTTDGSGYVIIEGEPGTWSFSASAEGYETNNWDQEITETDTKDAFLQKAEAQQESPDSVAPDTQDSENSVVGMWKVHEEYVITSTCTDSYNPGGITTKGYANCIDTFHKDGTYTSSEWEACTYDGHCTRETPNGLEKTVTGEWIQNGDVVRVQYGDGSTEELSLKGDTMSWTSMSDSRDRYCTVQSKGDWSAERISTEESGNLNEVKNDARKMGDQKDIQSADDWIDNGDALQQQLKCDEALKAYNRAIELDPNNARAWSGRGSALHELGNYGEAVQTYDKALELDPTLLILWEDKGSALTGQGKYDEAMQAYDKALELIPEDAAGIWTQKGNVLKRQGKYDEAFNAYEKAIHINPDLPEAWISKGNALNDQGKYDDAIKAFDKAIEIDPTYASAWTYKGKALESLGHTTEANDAFAEAKELGYNS